MQMMKSITAIVLFLFLSSCVTVSEFPIEVIQPAKVNLAADIKNVALVSRNLKYTNDTLQNYYSNGFRRIKEKLPIDIDSLSVQVCLDSLFQKIQAQQRFQTINVLPVRSLPVQYVKNIGPPSKQLVGKIASDTHADALILLDMYSSFYSIFPAQNSEQKVAKVVTASIWTIYDASTVQILHHTSLIDTLYWDGLDDGQRYSASRIPNKQAALKIAAGLVGVKYAKNIVPSWATVYRNTLSNDQTDFTKAAELAKNNSWEGASTLWEKYTGSSNKRHQMQALYNLAVASEMNGDIDTANELIARASKLSSSASYRIENKAIRAYAAVLAKRKIELNKVNSMSHEF